MRVRLRLSDGSSIAGEFEPASQDQGTDQAGQYQRLRYRLKATPASQPPFKGSVNAMLEIRQYSKPDVITAALEYEGPPLAATDGVQFLINLDSFARGMALKQLKLYWTAPSFVSDHRLLSPANQLILWKQMKGENYHVMVPLAGDGMVGTLGVSEIDYRYEFRVSSSSYDSTFSPRRIPLFAYAASVDPHQLTRDTYAAVFASGDHYGRPRWEKSYPEIFRSLGWCSWNTYYQQVSEEKIINSARSLRDQKIPVGFILVDDGWLTVKENKLAGFDADPKKFPNGMAGLARTLREQYHIPHIGVWHTFQGYWDGVYKDGNFGSDYRLFTGVNGKSLPDPRDGAGLGFYSDWYSNLKNWGYDFVKVDGQSNIIKFTNGLMPLFASGGGEQRNLQEAARKHFSDQRADSHASDAGLNVINCMEMTLENAFNWRFSNLARNSDDYLPDSPQNAREHIYQNAYNAYWTSNFAYPDWDMFQTHDPNAEFHAVARAISGGPVYFTDEPGKEHPEMLRKLIFSDGRLLMTDEPGQVTKDLLLTDTSLEPAALKVFGRVTRPGLSAVVIAAFNVNKSAPRVTGSIGASDMEVPVDSGQTGSMPIAVYRRADDSATLLAGAGATLPISLGEAGFDLFTLAPVQNGIAVFGLLDKYLGPAAVTSLTSERDGVTAKLREAGDFGAWLERAPSAVEIDGRRIPSSGYTYKNGLLRIPRGSFTDGSGQPSVHIALSQK
jgi:hypothetical protein